MSNKLIKSSHIPSAARDVSPTGLAIKRAATLAAINDADEEYQEIIAALSVQKRNKLEKRLDSLQFSVALTAPITCLGAARCPFFQACPIGNGVNESGKPLYDADALFPIGKQCILERMYVEQRLASYMEEFFVDPSMISEMSLLNDLITIDLQKQRALLILSIGDAKGFGRDFTTVSYGYSDKEVGRGEVTSEETKEHPLMARIDSLDKKRISILDQLNATRKAKAAIAKSFAEEVKSNKMLDDLNSVKNAINSLIKGPKEASIDAEFIALD